MSTGDTERAVVSSFADALALKHGGEDVAVQGHLDPVPARKGLGLLFWREGEESHEDDVIEPIGIGWTDGLPCTKIFLQEKKSTRGLVRQGS